MNPPPHTLRALGEVWGAGGWGSLMSPMVTLFTGPTDSAMQDGGRAGRGGGGAETKIRVSSAHKKVWVQIRDEFLQSSFPFLVGHQLTEPSLRPRSGIKQGDALSPRLFPLLTEVLVHKIKLCFPLCAALCLANECKINTNPSPFLVTPPNGTH